MNPTTFFEVTYIDGHSIVKFERIKYDGTAPPIYPHLGSTHPFTFYLAEVGKVTFTKMNEEGDEHFECCSDPHTRARRSFFPENQADRMTNAKKIEVFRSWEAALKKEGLATHPKDHAFLAELTRLEEGNAEPRETKKKSWRRAA